MSRLTVALSALLLAVALGPVTAEAAIVGSPAVASHAPASIQEAAYRHHHHRHHHHHHHH